MIDERRLERLLNVGSFKWSFLLKRLFMVALVATIILTLSMKIAGDEAPQTCPYILYYIFIILAFTSVSEVNMMMVRWFSRSRHLRDYLFVQMLLIVGVTALIVFAWVKGAILFFGNQHILSHQVMQLSLFFGVLLMIIMHTMVMMSHIAKAWLESRKELEKLQRAKLLSDYNSLQDRLNPHFLFNNLSVLRSLIRYSPDDAERFTENFTDVYRYLLKSHESQTVTIENELNFLKAYIALHKERLGNGLEVSIQIKDSCYQREVPPMAIQLLVENAIKHNIASRQSPLTIMIENEGSDKMCISNNINIKQTTYSTKTGLKTLAAQYQLIANKDIEIVETEERYLVKIPLL